MLHCQNDLRARGREGFPGQPDLQGMAHGMLLQIPPILSLVRTVFQCGHGNERGITDNWHYDSRQQTEVSFVQRGLKDVYDFTHHSLLFVNAVTRFRTKRAFCKAFTDWTTTWLSEWSEIEGLYMRLLTVLDAHAGEILSSSLDQKYQNRTSTL